MADNSNARPDVREAMLQVAPRLAELTTDVVFGDIWERPGLSKRDRSLIIVAVLTALYRTDQLRGHIGRALDNGVKGLSPMTHHPSPFTPLALFLGRTPPVRGRSAR